MQRNPFADEPISDDEKGLAYHFDPKHDYFADVDAIHPPWQPPPGRLEGQSGAYLTGDGEAGNHVLRRQVEANGRRVVIEQQVGGKRYYRAVDPAGNLGPVAISTCRPDRDHPNGDDGLATRSVMIAKKSARGWLFVERAEDCWNPRSGLQGQEYCAWALAVMAHRKELHRAAEERERTLWMEDQKRRALEMEREKAKITGSALAEALRAASAETAAAAAAAATAAVREAVKPTKARPDRPE